MNIRCLVTGHKWEMHNTKIRGDWRSCLRCGKEQSFHPDFDRGSDPAVRGGSEVFDPGRDEGPRAPTGPL